MNESLLYLAARLPALSETFVYNEVLALRDRGVPVAIASVFPPTEHLGPARLEKLAREATCVYGPGPLRLLADALREALRHPARAAFTATTALRDALLARDLNLWRRAKIVWQTLAALALARRVRPRHVAHIHAHMAHVPTTIAMYAAQQLGISFSFTGHANDLFPQRALLEQKLRRARFAACISHWHRAFYRSIVPLPDERVPIVRCGVELPAARTAKRATKSTPVIVAVGRLIPKKGFDVLIRAVARLATTGHRVDCRIIGDGPQRAALAALRRDLGVAHLVHLTGPQSNAEVKAALAQADLFALPCRIAPDGDRDGIPVVLMEAMAAGLCVISGDLPPIRELVRAGETGVLIPPADEAALANALHKLIDDDTLRRQLGERARQWVGTEFAADRNVDRLLAALDGAVSARNQCAGEPTPADRQTCVHMATDPANVQPS